MLRSLLLCFAVLFAACDGTVENDFTPEVVVESYQIVGEPFAPVYVLRNAPVGAAFDRNALAIRDATVEVQLLGEAGDVEARYAYRNSGGDRYDLAVMPEGGATVLPLRRYRLEVRVPGEPDVVSAEMLTPGAFDFVTASADTATYGVDGEELTFNVTRPAYPTRQAVFLFTTETLLDTLTTDDAVPFIRAILDRSDDGDFELEDLRVGASPLINEKTYEVAPDGTLQIELPWIAVPFYGPSRVSANAVDDNLYDFLRSQAVQQGGSTLSPGEIPNVLDRVENGAGIFGGFSRVSRQVFVKK